MALTQPESDVIYKRLINTAVAMRDLHEEIDRLKSANVTFDFPTNLLEPTISGFTKAEALAYVTGPMFDFADFWDNLTVTFDTLSAGSAREDKINELLLAEPLSG